MNEKQKMKKTQSQEKSQEEKYNKKRMMGKKEHMRSMNMKGKGVEGCCPMYGKKTKGKWVHIVEKTPHNPMKTRSSLK